MSFWDGMVQEQQREQQYEMNQLMIGQAQLQTDFMKKQMVATQQSQQLWKSFDPSDPSTSLMKIAAGMGAAGDEDGAMKALGGAEQINLRKQQALNYQSEVDYRKSQEEHQRKQEELAQVEEGRKAKSDEVKAADEARKEEADRMRFAEAQAREERMSRQQIIQDRLAQERMGIMMKHLDLSSSAEARRSKNESARLTLAERAADDREKSERLRQDAATDKLKENAQKLAIPNKERTDAALAVLDEDERTKSMSDSSKQSLAKMLASRAGKDIADNMQKSGSDWSPEDFDGAIRDHLDKSFKDDEIKVENPSMLSRLFGSKAGVTISRKSPGKTVAASAAASAKGPTKITSDADYNKLPSGTEFIGPDGVKRRKP